MAGRRTVLGQAPDIFERVLGVAKLVFDVGHHGFALVRAGRQLLQRAEFPGKVEILGGGEEGQQAGIPGPIVHVVLLLLREELRLLGNDVLHGRDVRPDPTHQRGHVIVVGHHLLQVVAEILGIDTKDPPELAKSAGIVQTEEMLDGHDPRPSTGVGHDVFDRPQKDAISRHFTIQPDGQHISELAQLVRSVAPQRWQALRNFAQLRFRLKIDMSIGMFDDNCQILDIHLCLPEMTHGIGDLGAEEAGVGQTIQGGLEHWSPTGWWKAKITVGSLHPDLVHCRTPRPGDPVHYNGASSAPCLRPSPPQGPCSQGGRDILGYLCRGIYYETHNRITPVAASNSQVEKQVKQSGREQIYNYTED